MSQTMLPLPITQAVLRRAEQTARQQTISQKADQARLNAIAVGVMHDYLMLMDIPSNPSSSDAWNPIVQLASDVADLELPGLGRLECRSLLSSDPPADCCLVPPETWEDRIGYVVLAIDPVHQAANLLGFVETASLEELPLSQLQSPEALLEHLDRLRTAAQTVSQVQSQAQSQAQTLSQPERAAAGLVQLGQWAQGLFEAGWQSVEALMLPPQLGYGFRGAIATDAEAIASGSDSPAGNAPLAIVRRVKSYSFGDRAIVLLVEIAPGAETQIYLQVHPIDQRTLPAGLQMLVLDEAGDPFLEAVSQAEDDYLQLELSGSTGETFSVGLAWAGEQAIEAFEI